MNDPFAILGLPPDADDDAIRQAYMQQVRRFPAERDPDRFQRIRTAYEQVKTQRDRLRYRLFSTEAPTAEDILEHLDALARPGRPEIEQFRALLRRGRHEIE